jgi:hypothetical protein
MIEPMQPRKNVPLQNLALTSSITTALQQPYHCEDSSVNVGHVSKAWRSSLATSRALATRPTKPSWLVKSTRVVLATGHNPSFTKAHKRGARWKLEITFKQEYLRLEQLKTAVKR